MKTKLSKVKLTESMLVSANAKYLGGFSSKMNNIDPNALINEGYYFITATDDPYVQARFFAGRQRCNQGFGRKLNMIRQGVSGVDKALLQLGTLHVYYIAPEQIKHLFAKVEKGWFKKNFPKTHATIFQNLNEVNRMLNDKFIFNLQKY